MGDSIFVRVQRVVSSGVGVAIDTVERASSHSLMTESVREAENAIDRVRAEQRRTEERRRQNALREAQARAELAKLDEQARFAIDKRRVDLAEAAVTRQVELEAELAALAEVRDAVAAEEERLAASVADLSKRHAQLKADLRAYRQAQHREASVEKAATPVDVRMAEKLARAEEHFQRALEDAGGQPTGSVSTDAASKLAEIEALKKQVAVAEKLAALREQAAPAAPARPRKARSRA